MHEDRVLPDRWNRPAPEDPISKGNRVCLGLGSNIDPQEHLPRALELLSKYAAIEAVSTAWETPAVGNHGPDFLNAAVLVRTPLPPELLKSQVIRHIEKELGRVRTANKNAPRTIDIDILLVDHQVIDPDLWTQAYLAVPVAELLPDYPSGERGETLAQVAHRLAQITSIRPRPDVLPGSFDR
jgi:2-amino-4-hydroxy-6-hydroxymethyldihydropteridine diphosphokinase